MSISFLTAEDKANDADDKGRGIINVNYKDPEPLADEFEADEDGMKKKKGSILCTHVCVDVRACVYVFNWIRLSLYKITAFD